jgi:hypothetical protein
MYIGDIVRPVRKTIGGHLKESIIWEDVLRGHACRVARIFPCGVILVESILGHNDLFLEGDLERAR